MDMKIMKKLQGHKENNQSSALKIEEEKAR